MRLSFIGTGANYVIDITVCDGSAGAAMPMLWRKAHGDTVERGSDAEDNVRCVGENKQVPGTSYTTKLRHRSRREGDPESVVGNGPMDADTQCSTL